MINLVGKRYIYLAASVLVILPGLIAILLGGLKPGIDFTGGTRWELAPIAAHAKDTDLFRQALDSNGHKGSIVKGGTLAGPNNVITNTIIMDIAGQLSTDEKARLEDIFVDPKKANLVAGQRITETQAATQTVTGTVSAATTPASGTPAAGVVTGTTTKAAATGVTTGTNGTASGSTTRPGKIVTRYKVNPQSEIDFRSVGPTVGQELIGRAFLAILAAATAILLYLTIVFRRVPNSFRYGVCAIVALLHDVLVVVGIFAILGLLIGKEIDALFITAMLTVIGFSVHDTIVVFDRVRENILKRRFERFEDVVNYSLVQTLARSINTSITVLLTLFALYLFGGASVKDFVLALLIGILSGTYSSIFNASMLLVVWENREWNRGRNQAPTAGARRAAAR